VTARWYGEEAAFRVALEAGARRRYGRHLTIEYLPDVAWNLKFTPGPLVYIVDGIDVRGRVEAVPVEVQFHAKLPERIGRLIPAEDYPAVFADRGKPLKHRLGNGALCLYYPGDPPNMRWTASMGLLSLLEATAEHIYFEDYARAHGGQWLGVEAPHGVPR
jgi:hypothetical protein